MTTMKIIVPFLLCWFMLSGADFDVMTVEIVASLFVVLHIVLNILNACFVLWYLVICLKKQNGYFFLL